VLFLFQRAEPALQNESPLPRKEQRAISFG
jgi:hypothetical protein